MYVCACLCACVYFDTDQETWSLRFVETLRGKAMNFVELLNGLILYGKLAKEKHKQYKDPDDQRRFSKSIKIKFIGHISMKFQ